jgi:hypothetical protein
MRWQVDSYSLGITVNFCRHLLCALVNADTNTSAFTSASGNVMSFRGRNIESTKVQNLQRCFVWEDCSANIVIDDNLIFIDLDDGFYENDVDIIFGNVLVHLMKFVDKPIQRYTKLKNNLGVSRMVGFFKTITYIFFRSLVYLTRTRCGSEFSHFWNISKCVMFCVDTKCRPRFRMRKGGGFVPEGCDVLST